MSKEFVRRVAEVCTSRNFERIFDEFSSEHAHKFQDAAECKCDEDVEHKHEYKEVYDSYLALFEAEILEVIEQEGGTLQEFYQEVKDASEGNFTALFEDHELKWFSDHLLASIEYKHFYGLMVNEARRQLRK